MNPIHTAPSDTMVRLLVQFERHSTEDSEKPAWTIGFLTEGVWYFAGWDWTQDQFCTGVGTPQGWLPV